MPCHLKHFAEPVLILSKTVFKKKQQKELTAMMVAQGSESVARLLIKLLSLV